MLGNFANTPAPLYVISSRSQLQWTKGELIAGAALNASDSVVLTGSAALALNYFDAESGVKVVLSVGIAWGVTLNGSALSGGGASGELPPQPAAIKSSEVQISEDRSANRMKFSQDGEGSTLVSRTLRIEQSDD